MVPAGGIDVTFVKPVPSPLNVEAEICPLALMLLEADMLPTRISLVPKETVFIPLFAIGKSSINNLLVVTIPLELMLPEAVM